VKNKFGFFGLVVLTAIVLIGCPGGNDPGTLTPASVVVTPPTANVEQGQTRQFEAGVLPADASQAVSWTVDSPAHGATIVNGLLTVPSTVPATTVLTVRATAAGTQISGYATVTVTAQVTIPDCGYCNDEGCEICDPTLPDCEHCNDAGCEICDPALPDCEHCNDEGCEICDPTLPDCEHCNDEGCGICDPTLPDCEHCNDEGCEICDPTLPDCEHCNDEGCEICDPALPDCEHCNDEGCEICDPALPDCEHCNDEGCEICDPTLPDCEHCNDEGCEICDPAEPTFGISLNAPALHSFPALTHGYAADARQLLTVTVTNTGNQPTGALSVALSGDNPGSFTASPTTISSIAMDGGTAIFTVTPNIGLAVGTHTATVTVTGGNAIAAFNVTFTVNAATFGISLDAPALHSFPALTHGYTADARQPLTVTVTNTGNQPTGALSVAMSGDNPGSFTASPTTISSIAAAGGTATFTVTPNIGLAVGTHTTIVTVTGGNAISAAFSVTFTVNAVPTFGISLNAPALHSFPALTHGYAADARQPLTVTVTNTGNQPTGALSVALSGDNPGSFAASSTTISSVVTEGGTATFTVTPNLGLAVGTHTAIVTVTGGNQISAAFNVTFTVNIPDQAFTINWQDFIDRAPGNEAITAPNITFMALWAGNAAIAVADPAGVFESVRWFFGGSEITGDATTDTDTGTTTLSLSLQNIGSGIGPRNVTIRVEVDRNGTLVPYSRVVTFNVTQ